MSAGFTKLHSGILGSTIWRESPSVKVVWITLLAMADQDGIVEATVPGLAAFSNVSVEDTEAAIEKFLSPDKYSRTHDYEGRRIGVIDGGWRLLNYEKYREKLSKEDLKERVRIRQQRRRERVACHAKRDESVTKCDGHGKSRMSRQAEAEAEAESKSSNTKPKARAQDGSGSPGAAQQLATKAGTPVDWIPVEAWAGYTEMRRKIRAPMTDRAESLIVKKLANLRDEGFDAGEVLDQSTCNNWKDVYPLKGNKSHGNAERKPIISRRTQEQYDALDQFKRAEARTNSRMGHSDGADDGCVTARTSS